MCIALPWHPTAAIKGTGWAQGPPSALSSAPDQGFLVAPGCSPFRRLGQPLTPWLSSRSPRGVHTLILQRKATSVTIPGLSLGFPLFITIANKGNVKECSNYHATALIPHANKLMLKILQGGLQQYMNQELPDIQAGFRKGRGIKDQIANICWIIENTREFQKNIYFCIINYFKALTVWITTSCVIFLKRWKC